MASYPNLDGDSIKYSRITDSTLNYSRITAPAEDSTEGDTSYSRADNHTLNRYQKFARTTAIYLDAGTGTNPAINYCILGLAGEAGEAAGKWSKLYRDYPALAENDDYPAVIRDAILNELGDVLWYVANISTELGVSLGEVANSNIQKLQNRKSRGTLTGSGDDR